VCIFLCIFLSLFSKSSSLFIEDLRDIGNLAVASILSFLKLWFFTLDLLPDLILVLWRTNFKSIPFPKEQRLLQYSCYSCLDLETSYRESGCRDKCRVSGRTLRTLSFVNSDEESFWWDMLLVTPQFLNISNINIIRNCLYNVFNICCRNVGLGCCIVG